MRPYFAVIQDSFREALASRVLWVLLVLITALLVFLVPLGYRQHMTRGLSEGAVRDWPHFIEHLREQSARPGPSPARHILDRLEESARQEVQDFRFPRDGDVEGAFKMVSHIGNFRRALNQLLEQRDFYDRETWGDLPLVSEEARALAKRDRREMSEDEVARWNRLALEAAYPEYVAASPPTSVRFRYWRYELGEPMPLRQNEFQRSMESLVERVTTWLVGTVGVFIAIVVTAAIIPQTFDPGSLSLLLSKPVRRWLLFLAKFGGGCMFILLNAAYLVLGLWLIMGFRFGLWNARILLSIPVYVFLFAVYYTVSALAGVLWRNAIVSIIGTLVFWLLCFGVGAGKNVVEQMILNKRRIVQLIPAQDSLLSVNEMGLVHEWDEAATAWREVFRSDDEEEMQRRLALAFIPSVPTELRPLAVAYDEHGDQLISVVRSFRTGRMTLSVGPRSYDWKAVRGAAAPLGTQVVLREPDGRLLFVSSLGLQRLVDDPQKKGEPVRVFGLALPVPATGPFASMAPEPGVAVLRPADAAINRDTGELAIYSRGTVTLLSAGADGRYQRRLEKKLEDEPSGDVVLAFGGDTLLIGRDDGRVIAYAGADLELRQSWTVEGKNPPRFCAAAPGGRFFAIVFHHGTLWVYDREADELRQPRAAGQGDISCSLFLSPERIAVVDRTTRVTEYDLPDWQVARRCTPTLSVLETVYRYALTPLYTVFPKPGELDRTVQYIMTGKQTASTDPRGGLAAAQKNLHPWRPVASSLAFMAVLLALACLYLERQDF